MPFFVTNKGQNTDDFQYGITRVPLTLPLLMREITSGILEIGGPINCFHPPKFEKKHQQLQYFGNEI